MRIQGYVFLGWSPLLGIVSDGERRVLQVTGWEGGTGTAPATGLYVGPAGYVALIADAVDIRGATGGGGGGAGISGGTNSQSTGTVNFSNSNGVSFGLNTNGVMTATVATNYQSQGAYLTTAMQSNAGSNFLGTNTALTANGVSVTANSSGLSLNFPAFLTTAQPVGAYLTTAMLSNAATISNIKLSAGTLSALRSDISFNNSNGVSFGLETNGIITATVATNYQSQGAYLTTAMASNRGSDFVQANAVFAGTNATGTIASNGISVSVAAQSLQPAQTGISSIVFSNTTYTSGALSFSNGNGISWASTTGQAISIAHDLQFTSATSAITSNALHSSASRVINIVAATNAAGGGAASLSGNVSFTNANGATFYTSAGGAIALSYSAPAGANSSLTIGAGGSTLSSVSQIAFSDANGISFLASTSNNGSMTISANHALQFTSATSAITSNAVNTSDSRIQGIAGSNTTYTSGNVGFRDTNGITWQSTTGQQFQITHGLQYTSATSAITSQALNITAARIQNIVVATNSTGGGTVSLTGIVNFANSNNFTFFRSAGSDIIFSYSQTNQNISLYATGNTTQNSSTVLNANSLLFRGTGNASIGFSDGSIIISDTGAAGGGLTNINVSAGTTSNNLSQLVFSNANRVTFGMNSNTVTASVGIDITVTQRMQYPPGNLTAVAAMGNGSYSINRVDVNEFLSATRLDVPFLLSLASSAAANTWGLQVTAFGAVYTKNVSTLSSLSSGSTAFSLSLASNTAGATGVIAHAIRPISVPMNVFMSPGEYYIGFGISTNTSSAGTATTALGNTWSVMGGFIYSSAVGQVGDFTAATNTSTGLFGGQGIYSAAISTVPPTVSLSAINQTGSFYARAHVGLLFRNI